MVVYVYNTSTQEAVAETMSSRPVLKIELGWFSVCLSCISLWVGSPETNKPMT